MKEIKMFEGVDVTVDGETQFTESPQEMFALLNMGADEYKDARIAVLRHLVAFHEMDLSAAYKGHTVTLKIVPVKEEEK